MFTQDELISIGVMCYIQTMDIKERLQSDKQTTKDRETLETEVETLRTIYLKCKNRFVITDIQKTAGNDFKYDMKIPRMKCFTIDELSAMSTAIIDKMSQNTAKTARTDTKELKDYLQKQNDTLRTAFQKLSEVLDTSYKEIRDKFDKHISELQQKD